jgi:hypothetical protein
MAWLEFDVLLTPQPELLLYLEAHAHVGIGDTLQGVAKMTRLVLIGHQRALRNGELVVIRRNDPRPPDLFGPPAQDRHAVLDRASR